ncbi:MULTISPECIES: hypothetical protein [unclassified Pseudomonas]|uniref:hypothetical protein n=1 Tax=unclassified Pseudomonas TaxID=196821 RepID=UPI0012FC3256|nr:hypothetical protein [Pseudomonas sp. M47T1]
MKRLDVLGSKVDVLHRHMRREGGRRVDVKPVLGKTGLILAEDFTCWADVLA